jgi:hypothetical protein
MEQTTPVVLWLVKKLNSGRSRPDGKKSKMTDKTISLVTHKASKDEQAQREYRANYLIRAFVHSHNHRDALLNSPLEEKEAFVRAHNRRAMKWVAAVGVLILGLMIYRHLVPAPPAPVIPPPTFEAAGVVQDIQLHSTTFSTETTVKTSSGIFQVVGGVSASLGDEAQIKRESANSLSKSSLCIRSQIKTACYSIL